jgi:hypothetical protein
MNVTMPTKTTMDNFDGMGKGRRGQETCRYSINGGLNAHGISLLLVDN